MMKAFKMRVEWRLAAMCIVSLVLAAFVVVEMFPWLWSSTWTALPYCGKGRNFQLADTICILFVASPHVMPDDGWMSNSIRNRFLMNIFSSASSFVSPDVVAFVGNFGGTAAQGNSRDGISGGKEWALHDVFVLSPETQVVYVPGDSSMVASHHLTSGSVVEHPKKLKFLDLMVWPNDHDPEIAQRISSLKAYASDYDGSVQMMIGCRSPAWPDSYSAILPDLKPHIIFWVNGGQASHQLCSLGIRRQCGKLGHFFDSDVVGYALRNNLSSFVDVQLPAYYEMPGQARSGFMAAHMGLFGDAAIEVMQLPTRAALTQAFVAIAATPAALAFILTRLQARTHAIAIAKGTHRWLWSRLVHLKRKK